MKRESLKDGAYLLHKGWKQSHVYEKIGILPVQNYYCIYYNNLKTKDDCALW